MKRSVKSVFVAATVAASGLVVTGAVPLMSSVSMASSATIQSCVPTHMKVSHGAPQGAAGTTYIPLIFTNTGSACAIFGVPSIQPVAGVTHRRVGPAARNLSMGEMGVRHVVLKGRSVSVAFGVEDTGNFPSSNCVARRADGVMVSLSSFVHPTYVRLAISVCTKLASTTTKLIAAGTKGY